MKKNKIIVAISIIILVLLATVALYPLEQQPGPYGIPLCDSLYDSVQLGTGIAQSFIVPTDPYVISINEIGFGTRTGGTYPQTIIFGLHYTLDYNHNNWMVNRQITISAPDIHHTRHFGADVPVTPGQQLYIMFKPASGSSNLLFWRSNAECYGNGHAYVGTTQQTYDLHSFIYGESYDLPWPLFTWSPTSPQIGETVTFDASTSIYADEYRWQFTSGGQWTTWSASPIITHSYQTSGSHAVKLDTKNDYGSKTKSHTITVQGAPLYTLSVTSTPTAASITLTPPGQNKVSPCTFTGLAAGSYTISASKEGYYTLTANLQIQGDLNHHMVLTQLPPSGYITCWKCQDETAVPREFPEGTVCGEGEAIDYIHSEKPDCTSTPPPPPSEGNFLVIILSIVVFALFVVLAVFSTRFRILLVALGLVLAFVLYYVLGGIL